MFNGVSQLSYTKCFIKRTNYFKDFIILKQNKINKEMSYYYYYYYYYYYQDTEPNLINIDCLLGLTLTYPTMPN